MAIRTYDILLDSYNSTIPEPIVGRQGDKNGAVTLHVTITDRGSAVDLTGQTINLMAETAKGTSIIADNGGVTVTNSAGGKFDYAIPNALWSEAGKITRAYFSINGTDGQQATYDLIFIVKKSIDIDKKHADDYVTIIDGTLRDLQKKVNAIDEAYKNGEFYNKTESDNAIQAESQARHSADVKLTDQLESDRIDLEGQILKMASGAPTDVVDNTTTLTTKYPNGSKGLIMVTADQYLYHWNGSAWEKAIPYPAVNLTDGSASYNKRTRLGEWGMIVDRHNNNLTVSINNKLMKWNQVLVINGNSSYTVPAGEASLTVPSTIMYDTVDNTFYSAVLNGGLDARLERSLYIGILDADDNYVFINTNSDYKTDYGVITNQNTLTQTNVTGRILVGSGSYVNLTTAGGWKLHFPFNTFIEYGNTYYKLDPNNPIGKIDNNNTFDVYNAANTGGWIVFDNRANFRTIKAIGLNETIYPHMIVIGIIWGNAYYTLFGAEADSKINGNRSANEHSVINRNATIIMSPRGNFELNTSVSPWVCTYPGHQVLLGDIYGIPVSAGSFQVPVGFGGLIAFDYEINQYHTYNWNESLPEKNVPAGYIWRDGDSDSNMAYTHMFGQHTSNDFPSAIKPVYFAFGHSIPHGYNGTSTPMAQPYPFVISNNLNANLSNYAHDGAKIIGVNSADFDQVLGNSGVDISKANYITIDIGYNDYAGASGTLDEIKSKFKSQLEIITSRTKKALIYGFLPLPAKKTPTGIGEAMTTTNSKGFNLSQLCDALKECYVSYGIPTFDWRNVKMIKDYDTQLIDGLHPTSTTQIMIGNRLSGFITSN